MRGVSDDVIDYGEWGMRFFEAAVTEAVKDSLLARLRDLV